MRLLVLFGAVLCQMCTCILNIPRLSIQAYSLAPVTQTSIMQMLLIQCFHEHILTYLINPDNLYNGISEKKFRCITKKIISNKRADLNQKFLVWNFYVRMAKLSNEQN